MYTILYNIVLYLAVTNTFGRNKSRDRNALFAGAADIAGARRGGSVVMLGGLYRVPRLSQRFDDRAPVTFPMVPY